MYQFFCIVEGPDGTLSARRVPLEGRLQKELSKDFGKQVSAFLPEDADIIPYEPGYKPDDEIFVLEDYKLPGYVREALDTPDAVPELSEEELAGEHVKALFGIQWAGSSGSQEIAFQNFNSGQVLRRGVRYLFITRDTFQESDRTGLRVDQKVSSVYRDGDLYLQSETLVRRYLELDHIFKAATNEEIDTLLADAAFAPTRRQLFMNNADRWVRRKVTAIHQRGILQEVTVQKIVDTGRKFNIEVRIADVDGIEKIVIPEEKRDLKDLLRLLDEDLLESLLTETRYQVSSKRRING